MSNTKNKDLEIHQYWFKTWWGVLIIVLAFPYFWWGEIIYFIYIFQNPEEYKTSKFFSGLVLIALLILPITKGFDKIDEFQTNMTNNKILSLIEDQKFDKAQEVSRKNPENKYRTTLSQLNETNLTKSLEIAILKATPENYEAYINEQSYANIKEVDTEIKKQLIDRLDELPTIQANLNIKTQEEIANIQETIKKVNNSEYTIGEIPNLILAIPTYNPEVVPYRNQLIESSRRFQMRRFPQARKEHSQKLSNELWADNIEVHTKGTANSTIVLKSHIFVNNKNIQNTHIMIKDILQDDFRYDRVEYKWSTYGDYTYFNLDSPKDSFIYIVDGL